MLVKTHFPEPELPSRSGGRAISGVGVVRPGLTRTNVCKIMKIILNCNEGGGLGKGGSNWSISPNCKNDILNLFSTQLGQYK